MSSSKKVGITFQVPSKVYYGLKRYLNLDNDKLSRLFGAAAINRFIEIGYLNEFGDPIEIPESTIDFSNNISLESLRSLSASCDYAGNKK